METAFLFYMYEENRFAFVYLSDLIAFWDAKRK